MPIVLGAWLALGCARVPSPEDSNDTTETASLNGQAFAAVVDLRVRVVLRDGPVSMRLTDPGLAIRLPGRQADRRELHWTLMGARRAKPRIGSPQKRAILGPTAVPSAWLVGFHSRGRVIYDDVHPGVRLTMEGRRHAVAYRFDVAPMASAGGIRLRYEGAEGVRVEESGRALRVRKGGRALRERGLRCYEQIERSRHRRAVPCAYRVERIRDGAYEVAFEIGHYDRRRSLVVDPEIAWSSYLGGGGSDNTTDVAVDSSGDLYVAGWTESADFPTQGGFDTTYGVGIGEAFVAKVDSSGSGLVWSSYLGGSGRDIGARVAVDSSGNAYVTGYTDSDDFPTPGGFDVTLGFRDAFVTKVDASGSSLVWSSYLGGSFGDDGYDVAVDGNGNVYVTGRTASPDFPTPGGFDTTLGGPSFDAFVTKVDASGSSLVWSSYLGGAGQDEGLSIAVDGSGNSYITGGTDSDDFPTPGGFDTTRGFLDAFVTKVDASGSSLVWSSYLGGGAFSDYGYDVAVDGSGNAYVTGSTESDDFPTIGGFDTTFAGPEAFVTKVDASGSSLVWSSYLGGSDGEGGLGVAVDGTGNVYLTGLTNSPDFPTQGGFDTTFGGAFVTKVDASGSSLVWSSYLGGSAGANGYGVAVDGSGSLIITGLASAGFPTQGGFDTTFGGGFFDGFVTRIVCDDDGACDPGEDVCTCPADCPDLVGDGCCSGAEDACSDPACPPACGDGCCTGVEDCVGCAADCNCPEPTPEAGVDVGMGAGDPPVDPDGPVSDASAGGAVPAGCDCAVGAQAGVRPTLLMLAAVLVARRRRREDPHG